MDLKNIILSKRRKIQKSFQCWFHLYKLLEQANYSTAIRFRRGTLWQEELTRKQHERTE